MLERKKARRNCNDAGFNERVLLHTKESKGTAVFRSITFTV